MTHHPHTNDLVSHTGLTAGGGSPECGAAPASYGLPCSLGVAPPLEERC